MVFEGNVFFLLDPLVKGQPTRPEEAAPWMSSHKGAGGAEKVPFGGNSDVSAWLEGAAAFCLWRSIGC